MASEAEAELSGREQGQDDDEEVYNLRDPLEQEKGKKKLLAENTV